MNKLAGMNKPKILFICVHNSARSQMAEAFLNDICGAEFEAQSAGLEPGTLNPLVVEVMREAGFDISKNKTQAVFDVFKSGQLFTYVVTVCSEAEAGGCPIFPGPTQRLHWPFPDPSKVEGTPEEKLEKIRQIRDAIQRASSNSARRIAPGSLNWDETCAGRHHLRPAAEREVHDGLHQTNRFAIRIAHPSIAGVTASDR